MISLYNILYVDDEPSLLDIGKLFLEESGDFTVTTALSAPEGIRLLEQEQFDVIISDYQMPGMNGIQFLVEVRARFGQIPFILFTGRGREEVVIQALNSGADFYLQKGGEPESQFAELSHKIKSAALRKRAEDSLRKSEEKYRHLIEHANEAIVVVQDGLLRLVNQQTVKFTGYSEQELLSMQFSAFIHPDDRAMVVERYQKRMNGEEGPSRYVFRLSSKDGSIRWVELSVVVIEWEGRPATLNYLTDITERKRAEEALYESETRYREFFNTSRDSIFITSPEGRWIDFNDALMEMFGYEIWEEMFRLPVRMIYANPEERPLFLALIERDGYVKEYPMKLKQRHGTVIDTLITTVPVRNPDGSIKAFIGSIRDITALKRAEEEARHTHEELAASYEQITATEEELRQTLDELTQQQRYLRESEEKYRTVFENTGTATVLLEESRIISLANNGFVQLSGFSKEDIEGKKSWTEFVVKEDRERMLTQNLLRTRDEKNALTHYEFRFIPKSGDIRDIYLSIGVIPGTKKSIASLQDITGRKRAEEAFFESKRRLEAMATNIPGVVFRFSVNPDGTYGFDYISERSRQILGIENNTTTFFDQFTEGIVPENRERFLSSVQHAISTKTLWEFESQYVRTSGKKIWISAISNPVIENDTLIFDGVLFDNTNRKRAEEELLKKNEELNASYEELTATEEELRHNLDELIRQEQALRESEDRFRGIFDTITSGVAIYEVRNDGISGKDYIIKDFNKAALEIEGKKKDEVVGKSLFDLRPAIDEYGLIPVFQQVWETGVPAYFPQTVYIDEKYSNWYENRVFRLQSGEIVAVYDDVTERKRAELELVSAYENLKEAHRLAHIGTWDWVIKTDTVTWSEELCKIAGWDPSLPAPTYAELPRIYTPASWDLLNNAVTRALTSGEPYNLELELVRPDGSIRWTNAFGGVQHDETGKVIGLHGTLQDITERKLAEDALLQANKKLTLLSGITRHDINNQLTVLQGYLTLLEKKHPELSLNEYFQKATTAAERISAMIRFTKEYKAIGLNAPVWQNCHTLVDSAAKQAPLGKVTVKNDLPAGAEVFADPLIVRVCYNLMDNALRYGGKITTIRFYEKERDGNHVVIFEDDGGGIPAEEKEKIFERGYGKNTGLGLTLSREILDITGITIRETGEPGKGARFEMIVPKGMWRMAGEGA